MKAMSSTRSSGEARRRGLRTAVADVFEGNEPALHLLRTNGFVLEDGYREPSLDIRVHRFLKKLSAGTG